MKTTLEENTEIYIQMSKTNIDNYISKNEYRKAFLLLITVLERLDNDDKVEFIDYYSKRLNNINLVSHLDDRSLDYKKV